MNNNIAIKVEGLSKIYKLYNAPVDRMKEALSLRGKKYHKDFYALSNISFSITRGETVGIIGKNGSGKSTLLKIITGVLAPTFGNVTVNGKISALLELGAGFNPEYTGIENIYFQGSIMGYTEMEIKNKVDDILNFADIGDFIYQPVKLYSSGMFARLAFAVAINVEPDILIVDEALSVGDMFFQQKCLLRMKKMMENGVSVLFVSHSLASVRTLCRSAIYLQQGKLKSYGLSKDICNEYWNDSSVITNNIEKMQVLNNTETITNKYEFEIDPEFNNKIGERSGGGELSFVSFKIYDNNLETITTVRYYDEIEIRASFITSEDIPAGTAIGILVTDHNGNPLLGLNSNIYDYYLPQLPKNYQGVIAFKFKFPLLNTDCIFGIGAKPNVLGDYFYDRIFSCAYLQTLHASWMIGKNISGLIYVKDMQIQLL